MKEETEHQVEKDDLTNTRRHLPSRKRQPEPNLPSSIPCPAPQSLHMSVEEDGPLSFPTAYKINSKNKKPDLEHK